MDCSANIALNLTLVLLSLTKAIATFTFRLAPCRKKDGIGMQSKEFDEVSPSD